METGRLGRDLGPRKREGSGLDLGGGNGVLSCGPLRNVF